MRPPQSWSPLGRWNVVEAFVLVGLMLSSASVSASPIFIQTFVVNNSLHSDADAVNRIADDFVLATADTVLSVTWRGLYATNGTPPPIDAFTLNFYADAAGSVGGLLQSFVAGNAVNRTGTGQFLGALPPFEVFEYTADLGSGLALSGGAPYWLSVFNNTIADANDSWYWAARSDSGNARMSLDGGTTFPHAAWPSGAEMYFVLDDANSAPVPEPTSILLLGSGLAAASLRRRRSRRP